MMALGETGRGVSACPQLAAAQCSPPATGTFPRATLTASSSFDLADVGFGVNYYPEKAEAKVTSSWRCFSSSPPGMALGPSPTSLPAEQEGWVLLLAWSSTQDLCLTWCEDPAHHQPCAHLAAGTPGQGLSHRTARTGAGMDAKGFVSQSCIYAVKLCLLLA